MPHPQPGLDGRHRNADGTISRKHGNTRVDTLRRTYGTGFAGTAAEDEALRAVLDGAEAPSLSQLVKRR